MQEAKKNALSISNYFVSLPNPAKTVILIFLASFIFGAALFIAKSGKFGPTELFAGGLDGVVLLAFPAILASVGLYLLRRKAVFRRAVFLGLLTAICYGLFYFGAAALEGTIPYASNLIFVGFGLSFVLWYFMLFLAFDFRKSAALFATMQLVIFAAFFMAHSGIGAEGVADALTKMYVAAFVFLAALYAMFYLVSAPMKKNLGISSLDTISMFLSQWLYGEKDLEEVFAEIGEDIETSVFVGRFSGAKNDAIFIVPYMHFGPFGNLGGSEFTWMISDAISKQGKGDGANVFVFHGTATHDFNPVSSSEIGKVVGACRKALGKIKLSQAKMSLVCCKDGSVRCRAMKVNDSAFLSFSRAPATTEDVNFGIGMAILERARRYTKNACVIDEHNAETGDITSIEVGNPIGFEMLRSAGDALSGKQKVEKFLFACSSAQLQIDTLGKNGLKLALFARGKKLDAVLLADSNSITPDCAWE
ncbi:MAG: DUF2070 family protein [Candidatus Micrarchaeota archaeon]|nr:DUF2070 family protein [Candidatus Micrarchaeota archaeon]